MAEFGEKEREKLAKKGDALPDGSYPIRTCEDAMNARHAYGRAPESHRAAVRALINRREKELGCGRELFEPGD